MTKLFSGFSGCLVIWTLFFALIAVAVIVASNPDILVPLAIVVIAVFALRRERARNLEPPALPDRWRPPIDPLPDAHLANPPAPPPPMSKSELRARFHKELREGIIDQDEFDSLIDMYDLDRS